MKHTLAKAAFLLLVLALIAPAYSVGAFALSEADPLLFANLDRAAFEFNYTPLANSEYALFIFSYNGADVHAQAEILEKGEIIASGEGSGEICSAWLVSGVQYTVRVQGSGSAMIEMARRSLSRNFLQPLPAQENETSQKMIAHAYDAHWYVFEAAADGVMMLSCIPEDANLSLSAMILDESGALAGHFEALPGGACKLAFETMASKQYYIRISAPGGGEGYYALNLLRPDKPLPQPGFDAAEHVIAAGSELRLGREAGAGALVWTSSSPETARVLQNGTILALQPGETTITAHGMDSTAECTVRVEHVALESLNILGEAITISAGDDTDIQIEFFPENASDTRVRYHVQDTAIATVSRSGVLRALQPGETTITAAALDGGKSDTIRLVVTPAVRKYRALLVGEEEYPFAEGIRRSGSQNSVNAIQSLLGTADFENAAYSVRMGKDLSRAELIAEIRDTFKSATAQDVSLLYITSHGSYSGGMSFLELSDGSMLSMRDLERELRNISGTIVVMIDSCASGGAIGSASENLAFAKGVTGAFAGSSMQGSKYKVFASAGLDEDSYRIALSGNASPGVMATVFARALCDGTGWDIDRNTRDSMSADRNYDGAITLAELQDYMQGRIRWYLDIASELTGEEYRQSIQVYPEGDPLVIFERQS